MGSADGTHLVFAVYDYAIWAVEPMGGNQVQITNNDINDTTPDWSWAQ